MVDITKTEMRDIPLDQIDTGSRMREDYGDIKDLAWNIAERGLIHPIAILDKSKATSLSGISGLDKDKPYLLLAGGRRLSAVSQNGGTHIACRIYNHHLDADEIRLIELHENIKRKDLDWEEEVKLKSEVHELYTKKFGKKLAGPGSEGHSIKDTAKLFGESEATISRDIKLAKALEEDPYLSEGSSKHEAQKLLKEKKLKEIEEELLRRKKQKSEKTDKDVIKQNLIESYVVGDFFENKLPSEVFDIIEVDPPYGINLKKLKKDPNKTSIRQYHEVPEEEYVDFLQKTVKECHRLMKPHSWLIFWFAIDPWYSVLEEILDTAGFEFSRIPAVWFKLIPGQSQQPDLYLANVYETFFYARKGNPSIVKKGSRNIFTGSMASQHKIHPTERPVKMIEEVLKVFAPPAAKVLVPFAGSGNTMLAASNLGMIPIGFDLTDEYKHGYSMRIMRGEIGKLGRET